MFSGNKEKSEKSRQILNLAKGCLRRNGRGRINLETHEKAAITFL